MLGHRRGSAQHGRLLFFVGANLFEGCDFDPKPAASIALAHRLGANRDRGHVNLAAWTLQHRQLRGCWLDGRGAAVRAVLAPDEHHAEA